MKRALVAIIVVFGGAINLSHGAQPDPRSQSISVELTVSGAGLPGLERDLLLTLMNGDGEPLSDAVVRLSVDMPSMPMAHAIAPILAKPAGTPGAYVARVVFEMPGEWVAKIEVDRLQPRLLVRKFTVR